MNRRRGASGLYISWARLLKREFDIDMAAYPNCRGNVKIIADIKDPSVIKKILTHLSLSPHPLASTREADIYDAAQLDSRM
jgi:hypothetical protein